MEKEATFLRCSKLSCYAEFNRMVHAISVQASSSGGDVNFLKKGTGAEYRFYKTLTMMLNQVLSNPNPTHQRQELATVYQWFALNKPLTPKKVKPTAKRPQLLMTQKRQSSSVGRPHTAPAALGYGTPDLRKTPVCPPPTPSIQTFTSSYMTRSMATAATGAMTSSSTPASRQSTRIDWASLVTYENSQNRPATTTGQRNSPRLVVIPQCFEYEDAVGGKSMSSGRAGTTGSSLYSIASSIAAQMTLERMALSLGPHLLLSPQAKSRTASSSVVAQSLNITPDNAATSKPKGEEKETSEENKQPEKAKLLSVAKPPPPVQSQAAAASPHARPASPGISALRRRRSEPLIRIDGMETILEESEVEEYQQMLRSDDSFLVSRQQCHDKLSTNSATVHETGDESDHHNRQQNIHTKVPRSHQSAQQHKVPSLEKSETLVVTVTEKAKSHSSKQNNTSMSRESHRVHQVTLSLPNTDALNPQSLRSSRKPRSLVPVVAGFTKRRYRPHTVG